MLVCLSLMSLDGYTVDAAGRFDWARPSDEVHEFVNRLAAGATTHLYGRRMWETMRFWQDVDPAGDEPGPGREFARLWQAADKIVYSATLPDPHVSNTRVARRFDAPDVQRIIDSAPNDVSVGGSTLAGEAFAAGLVDVVDVITVPVTVGGGTPAFPRDRRVDLELSDQRHFEHGTTYHRYRVRTDRGEGTTA